MRVPDRAAAGHLLADRLGHLAEDHPVVLGLPRGGVPVAAEVASALQAPMDVVIVRKLGCPWQPELGVGALGEGGIQLLNAELMADLGLQESQLEDTIRREQAVIDDRVAAWRSGREAIPVGGRTTIVVDDGLATGFTARAAIAVLRRRGAGRVVLAVPVAPRDTIEDLTALADEVVCLDTPRDFQSVGGAYRDFTQVRDDDVARLLAAAGTTDAPHDHADGDTRPRGA